MVFQQPAVALGVIDWDQWRLDYRSLSFADQQAFYAAAAEAHPDQQHFDAQAVGVFLRESDARTVVEVGGWKGELAAALLPRFPQVTSWVNLEIAPNLTPACDDARYQHVVLDDWPWSAPIEGDVLILSHVVEHILLDELQRLITRFTGGWVYIDCPVGDGPQDWSGYSGSHVIERGWDGIQETLAGFRRVGGSGDIRFYRR